METLRLFLNSLAKPEQDAFAKRCGTSLGYLRKAISVKPKLSESLVIALERESGGAVPCELLRPDIDWEYLSSRRVVKSTRTASVTP